MILMIQPGSLQEYAGELLNAEKRDILRAEFVRNRIGNDKAV